ncbi:MAG: SHOCT domain-containing protein [Sediminibacterium sp. Gen4]|jgi:hypothetical protein|uniref:SHOCT domain-containing protein n=1 Tax=unclassified Sediminibacterium TaxID=2635961 RepID=UPI0015BAC52C|nr:MULTISPECIES: SHOCT domain-containing protein [unclassified Sediminibacterium]MBW0161252.1 SHOCT domain-containing protein [Sediminibacterium sp.]MBW0165790.1 SHOCT domain-containing protein [Sediminibacterium sp.]NWK64757.1 SHOCT domain-containing protein [Sediminibacterium sp. Gen4]
MSNDINDILGIKNISSEENEVLESKYSYTLTSKVLSLVAIISIIFLPFIGCGGDNINGADIVKSRDVPIEIKLFLIGSIICGVMILFLKKYIHLALMSVMGIFMLLVSYFIAKDKLGQIELKIGAIVSISTYTIIAISSFLKISERKNVEINVALPNQISQSKSESSSDIFIQIEKLNELRQKGILTDDEFISKKTELLSKV